MDEAKVIEPWEDPKDLLDRKRYAKFLTNYLVAKKHPFVLNLNASWGMGKTYFLSHWNHSIQDRHPTVYINAWETDFSDDPLLSVIAAIHDQLQDLLPSDQQTLEKFSEKLKACGRFIRSIAPTITKGLVSKALGEEAVKEIADTLPLSAEALADIAGKSMGILIDDHSQKIQSIKEFRIALSSLVDLVTREDINKPVFVFIDELDRCRPTYAIELLETVKHLFYVDGVVFVVATDSSQLQHSIRAIYGNEFDGAEYLRRFFDQEYILPEPDYITYCNYISSSFPHADKLYFMSFEPWNTNGNDRRKPNNYSLNDSMGAFLSMYSTSFKLSLRSINQVVVRLEAILDNSEKKWIGPIILLFLIIQAKHCGLIAKMKDEILKNTTRNQHDFLTKTVGAGGQTVRWKPHGAFGREPNDFDTLTIALTALNVIKELHHASISTLLNRSGKGDLQGDLFELMRTVISGGTPGFVDIREYFDHVEMAGALS